MSGLADHLLAMESRYSQYYSAPASPGADYLNKRSRTSRIDVRPDCEAHRRFLTQGGFFQLAKMRSPMLLGCSPEKSANEMQKV